MYRYNLALPDDLYNQVNTLAKIEGETFLSTVKRLLRIGLIVTQAYRDPGVKVFTRKGDKERELMIV